MHSAPILEYLKKHGQVLDSDIAAETRISIANVRKSLEKLSVRGDISSCSVTYFDAGKPITRMQVRLMGTIPAVSPGRKPGAPIVEPNDAAAN